MVVERFNLLSFTGKMRTLHFTWFAFFLSFVVWFNQAPLMASIKDVFQLSPEQIKALLILNVALTIPARILVGVLVDKLGPRLMYSLLLAFGGVVCVAYAFANSFEQLAIARFLLGAIGAGFVVGIRLVGEWFPAKEVGVAEGIYGGWGNFGSAVAAGLLPLLAAWIGGDDGWRYAIATTGVICFAYAFVYYREVRDTPKGSTYFKPKKAGAMEVTSRGDFVLYLLMTLPMAGALFLITWRLSPAGFNFLSAELTHTIYVLLVGLLAFQIYQMVKVNAENLRQPVPEIHRYKFKQVAVLNMAYLACFGSEIAVVSMLPMMFKEMFGLSVVGAGLLASTFVAANLFARPGGGWISDRFGRKKTLAVVMLGVTVGYALMGTMNASWPLVLVAAVTVVCSFFVQAGCGAVYAVVPLIKRRLTGQVAGMAGAYGNVGGVTFLTILSMVDQQTFFWVLTGTAAVTFVVVMFMDEPSGQTAEIMPDGSVQMISVS